MLQGGKQNQINPETPEPEVETFPVRDDCTPGVSAKPGFPPVGERGQGFLGDRPEPSKDAQGGPYYYAGRSSFQNLRVYVNHSRPRRARPLCPIQEPWANRFPALGRRPATEHVFDSVPSPPPAPAPGRVEHLFDTSPDSVSGSDTSPDSVSDTGTSPATTS